MCREGFFEKLFGHLFWSEAFGSCLSDEASFCLGVEFKLNRH